MFGFDTAITDRELLIRDTLALEIIALVTQLNFSQRYIAKHFRMYAFSQSKSVVLVLFAF
jgi:predicted XRE-type DNA-binding protein